MSLAVHYESNEKVGRRNRVQGQGLETTAMIARWRWRLERVKRLRARFGDVSNLRRADNLQLRASFREMAGQPPSALGPWPRVFTAKSIKTTDRTLSVVVQLGAFISTNANSENKLQMMATNANP